VILGGPKSDEGHQSGSLGWPSQSLKVPLTTVTTY
jgi:hypothetical protein